MMKNKLVFALFLLVLAFPTASMATGAGNWLINNDLSRPHKLYCTQSKMIDRIRCRLSMSPEELAQEMSIKFLPEECRAKTKKSQAICVEMYKSFKPCSESSTADEKLQCAKNALEISGSIEDELLKCNDKSLAAKKICVAEVKADVDSLASFKINDLIERAKATLTMGSNINPVVALENSLELVKQQYNKGKTVAAKKVAVVKARAVWKKYVVTNEAVGAGDGLDDVLENLDLVK